MATYGDDAESPHASTIALGRMKIVVQPSATHSPMLVEPHDGASRSRSTISDEPLTTS